MELCWQMLPLLVPRFQVCQQNFHPTEIHSCFPLHSFLTRCSPSISTSLSFSKLPTLVSCAQQVCVPVSHEQPRMQAAGGSECPGLSHCFAGVRGGV